MGMRLVEANIEGFGQYRNRQIVFSEGLNVIYGHNESGKTTLMKFIEGVLYGFYKPAQRRQYTADYEKYRPWDGGSYGGTLVYETEGQYVAVYRDFEKDEVWMWDVTTKEDLTKELPYNEFYRQWEPAARDFKISAAAFRNTISIVQGKASADLSQVGGELQESLLNLTSSGDEEISVRHSLSSLRQQWEQIGSESQEKNSLLGELSIREEALKARLRESGEARVRQERIYQELSQLPEDVEDAEDAFMLLERAGTPEQKAHMERLSKEETELIAKERRQEQTRTCDQKQYQALLGLQKDVELGRERLAEAELLVKERTVEPAEQADSVPDTLPEAPSYPIGVWRNAGLILCVLGVGLGVWLSPFCLILCAGGAGLLFYAFRKYQEQERQRLQAEREQRAKEEEKRLAHGRAEALYQDALQQKKQREISLAAAQERLQKTLSRLSVSSVEEYEGIMQEQIKREASKHRLTELREERTRWACLYASGILRDRRALLQKRLQELGKQEEDRAELREEMAQVARQKERLVMERDSLQAAAAAIESLSQEVRREYAPILTEKIKKTVENITAGRYNTIDVSNAEGIRAAGADGKDLPLDRLSAGTGDQIYFAVRLGMIDLLSPDVRLPLILDDAFARYDEERLRKILDLLCQEASSRQILIFSCQTREKEMLTQREAIFHYSEL